MANVNALPSPGALSTAIDPPIASTSRDIQSHWPQVRAEVVAVGDGTLTLAFPLGSNTVRGDVKREYAFRDLGISQTIALYVNPANPAQMRQAAFGELWAGTIALCVVAAFLAVVGVFLLRAGDDAVPAQLAEQFQRDMQAGHLEADSYHDSDALPRHPDDGRTIELREPSQSWKANVFWGLLFGLLAVVPALLAPPQAPIVEKYIWVAAGVGWMAFMGLSAYRNFGRKVVCDGTAIVLQGSSPSVSGTLSVVSVDGRAATFDIGTNGALAAFNVLVNTYATGDPLDTNAPMVMYVLRDAQGNTLLRLDRDMQPRAQMRRLLDRLENLTGVIG